LIPEIEKVIIECYSEFKLFCQRITKHNSYGDDLLQDVMLQLYQKDVIKIDKLDNKSIKNYIFRCLITNWYSKTSPFNRKVTRESNLYDEIADIPEIVDNNDDIEQHKLIEITEEEYGKVGWFHKDILSRYIILGSLKRVSNQTTIPITSINRYVIEAKSEVKLNVFKRIKDE